MLCVFSVQLLISCRLYTEPYRLCLEQRPCPWQGRTGYFLPLSLFSGYHDPLLVALAEEKVLVRFFLAFAMGRFFEALHLATTHRDNKPSSLGCPAAGAASDHSVRPT